jgi:hypothetical protein
MTIADEVPGSGRVEIAQSLRTCFEDCTTPEHWRDVANAMAGVMTRLSVETMSSLIAAMAPDDPMLGRLAVLTAAWERNSPQAVVEAAAVVLGVPASAVFTDPAINGLVDRPPPALNMLDPVFSGFAVRLAVWSARAAYGDHNAIRRGILDLDFATVPVKTVLAAVDARPICENIWVPLKDAVLVALKQGPTVTAEIDVELPEIFRRPCPVRQNSFPSPSL